MAVKVIKVKPPKSILKKVVHKECGATLEYLLIDVKSYHGTGISGGPDGSEWIDCPHCSGRVVLRSW